MGRFYLSTGSTYATVHVHVKFVHVYAGTGNKKVCFCVRLLCHDSLHLQREGKNHHQHHRSGTALPGLHSCRQGKFVRSVFSAVLRIRIHMFLGLLDPDPLVRGMDPDLDPDSDPSIIKEE